MPREEAHQSHARDARETGTRLARQSSGARPGPRGGASERLAAQRNAQCPSQPVSAVVHQWRTDGAPTPPQTTEARRQTGREFFFDRVGSADRACRRCKPMSACCNGVRRSRATPCRASGQGRRVARHHTMSSEVHPSDGLGTLTTASSPEHEAPARCSNSRPSALLSGQNFDGPPLLGVLGPAMRDPLV